MLDGEQVTSAFVAALRWEGVSETQIENAVTFVLNSTVGDSLSSGSDDVRDFAFAQSDRLGALRYVAD